MASKPHFLRNLLTTVSILAIISGETETAFGAIQETEGNADTSGLNLVSKVWNNNDSLSFENDGDSFTVNEATTIKALSTQGNDNTILQINKDTSLGSVRENSGILGFFSHTVSSTDGAALTLTGTGDNDFATTIPANYYNGLGPLTLANGSQLIINSFDKGDITLPSTIDGDRDHKGPDGTITIHNNVTFQNAIGIKDPIALINLNSTGGNAATFKSAVKATNINFRANGIVNFQELNVTGDIDFDGNEGTINLSDTVIINGRVNNSGIDPAGILNFLGNGTVRGTIGANTALKAVNFNGGANTTVTLNENASATTFTYGAAGTVNAEGNITGKVNFANHAGVLNLAAGQTITGNIDSKGGVNGTLNFAGAGMVDGIITNLAAINFNNAANINFKQSAAAENFTYNAAATVNATAIIGNIDFNGYAGILNTDLAIKGNINLNGGATVFAGDLITGDVTYGAAGTLTAKGGIKGNVDFAGKNGVLNLAADQTITGNVDSTGKIGGILNFAGNGEVTGTIGANRKLAKMNIQGANGTLVDLQDVVLQVKEIKFTNTGALQVSSKNIGKNTKVEAITATQHMVNDITVKGVDVTFKNNVGANGNALRDIIINNNKIGNKTVTIETNKFFAGITTKNNNQNNVILNKTDTTVYGLGTDLHALNQLTFTENAKIDGVGNTRGTYATTISINDNKTATFHNNMEVAGTNLNLLGANSVATFDTVGIINTSITGAGATANFNNVGRVVNNIGAAGKNLATVTFKGVGAVSAILPANIYAHAINFNGSKATTSNDTTFNGLTTIQNASTVTLAHNLTTDGLITLNDSTIDLGTNTLTINQGGAGNSNFTNARLSTTIDAKGDLGHIEIAAGNLTLDAPIIEIHSDGISYEDILKTKTFELVTGTLFDNGVVTIDDHDNAAFITWAYLDGKLTASDNRPAAAKVLIAMGAPPDVVDNIFDNDAIGDAKAQQNDVDIILAENSALAVEKLKRESPATLASASTLVTTASQIVIANTHLAVATRLSNVTPVGITTGGETAPSPSFTPGNIPRDINKEVPVSESYGIAAGEEVAVARHGLWVVPFYSQAQQKKLSANATGYKSRSAGGTIGLDFMPCEEATLGVAFSGVDTKFKHKDQKIGDRTNIKTFMLSLYGSQEFSNNWFVQGILSFGSNHIVSKAGRISVVGDATVKEIAKAKYQAHSYATEATLGRKRVIGKTIITPFAGLRLSKFSEENYKETGTDHANFGIKKGDLDKFEGIFGARIAMINKINTNTTIVPALQATFNYDFSNNRPTVESVLQGGKPEVTKTPRAGSLFIDLGASFNVQHKNIEFTLGYDALITKKYFGNQGSLKVRVNF